MSSSDHSTHCDIELQDEKRVLPRRDMVTWEKIYRLLLF